MESERKKARILDEGKVIWIRKVSQRKRGSPQITLPSEFVEWSGKRVEIEPLNKWEIRIRIINRGDEGKEGE